MQVLVQLKSHLTLELPQNSTLLDIFHRLDELEFDIQLMLAHHGHNLDTRVLTWHVIPTNSN